MIIEPSRYEALNSALSLLSSETLKITGVVNAYPVQAVVEDFYTTNKFAKNSLTMLKCSKLSRKTNFNFTQNKAYAPLV